MQDPEQKRQGDTSVEAMAANASKGLPSAQESSVKALFASTEQLADVEMDKPQDVLSAYGNILNSYYTVALAQSARSFTWAVVGAGVGVVLFIAALAFLLIRASAEAATVSAIAAEAATVSAIAGAIVELIAGLNFYLYGKATEQAANHRFSLERMQRYLLANSLVETIGTQEDKDKTRAELISAMSEDDQPTSRSQDNGKTRHADEGETTSRDAPPQPFSKD